MTPDRFDGDAVLRRLRLIEDVRVDLVAAAIESVLNQFPAYVTAVARVLRAEDQGGVPRPG
ncbi:hypothetical protein [Iamia sp.]|uniref:hypothetical protein n=1 Tax=Iamia sp. TaxID=2722710 RepID=UPI002BC04693|nr:hypothetical protein [Iamia sp.]HXH56363.1 hypothetical protein [Iamia sp.]